RIEAGEERPAVPDPGERGNPRARDDRDGSVLENRTADVHAGQGAPFALGASRRETERSAIAVRLRPRIRLPAQAPARRCTLQGALVRTCAMMPAPSSVATPLSSRKPGN